MCTRTPRPFLHQADAVEWRETFLLHLICQGTVCQATSAPIMALGGMKPAPTVASAPEAWQMSLHSHLDMPSSSQFASAEASECPPEPWVPDGLFGPRTCAFPLIAERLYVKCGLMVPEALPIDSGRDPHCPSDPWLGSCYIQLSGDQLALQKAPHVTDLNQLSEERSLLISQTQRLKILRNQDLLWADDELLFHFRCIQDMAKRQGFSLQVVDPLLATGWFAQTHVVASALDFLSSSAVVTAIKVQYHWIPLVLIKTGSFLNAHSWHHRAQQHPAVSAFVLDFARKWGCLDFRWVIHHTRQTIEHHCGPMAVALVMHVVLQVPTPTGVSDLVRVQHLLRKAFVASLPPLCQAPRMWASGVNEQAADELRPVLVDHGVPKEQAQSRAQAAVRAIGGSQI
eukprot:s2437_g21.t1